MGPRKLLLLCSLLAGAAAGGVRAEIPEDVKRALALRDYEHAAIWLEDNQSDPEAAFELAKLYRQGRGVAEDQTLALNLILSAAAAGHRDAQYQAGRHYERLGQVSEATVWMSRAADSGHRRAAAWQPPSSLKTSILDQIRAGQAPPAGIDPAVANGTDPGGRTLLMLAADRQAVPWVLVLLTAGAQVDSRDPQGATALHHAVLSGNAEVVRSLLEADADPNLTDTNGNTALHLAVAAEFVPVISALRDSGAEPTVNNTAGWTAVDLARRSDDGQIQALFGLSAANQSPASSAVLDRVTLLRRLSDAALKQDLAKVKRLIAEPQFDPQLREVSELLIKLAETGASGSLKLMLGAGVPSERVDARGRTALLAAAAAAQPDCVDSLVAGGAALDSRDAEGRTALILASKSGSIAAADVLINAGADAGAVDLDGRNALWWASRSGHELLGLHLLDSGVQVQADSEGVGPLHLAAAADLVDLVVWLAGLGSVDETTGDGHTALMIAAKAGSREAGSRLLSAGAGVSLRNPAGDTALIIATRESHLEVARLLLENGANPETRNDRFESASSIAMARADARWPALMEAHSRDVLDLLGTR